MPLGAPSARHTARADKAGLVEEGEGFQKLKPWEGICPECNGIAVYREVRAGQVAGACSSGEKCWWSSSIASASPDFGRLDRSSRDRPQSSPSMWNGRPCGS